MPSYLEASRRGGHLWVFCDRLVKASQLRRWLLPSCPAGVEFYPKQDEGTSGFGSLIRLPLGVHRLSHCRYWFISWWPQRLIRVSPVAQSVLDSLLWLRTLRRATVPDEASLCQVQQVAGQDAEPSLAKKPFDSTMPLATGSIGAWCASQDALQVIG